MVRRGERGSLRRRLVDVSVRRCTKLAAPQPARLSHTQRRQRSCPPYQTHGVLARANPCPPLPTLGSHITSPSCGRGVFSASPFQRPATCYARPLRVGRERALSVSLAWRVLATVVGDLLLASPPPEREANLGGRAGAPTAYPLSPLSPLSAFSTRPTTPTPPQTSSILIYFGPTLHQLPFQTLVLPPHPPAPQPAAFWPKRGERETKPPPFPPAPARAMELTASGEIKGAWSAEEDDCLRRSVREAALRRARARQ